MPQAWNPSLYRTNDAQTLPPDPSKIQILLEALNDCSTRIQKDPYNPEIWRQRATYHLNLNFPELAASDAYKATLLLERAKHHCAETTSTLHSVLGQALLDCHCHWELADFWDGVSKRYSSEYAAAQASNIKALLARKSAAGAHLGGTVQERKDRLRDGGVVTVTYPWMHERHLVRSPELVQSINNELSCDSEQTSCYLAQSTLSTRSDMLGMFAARDIHAGETFLIDRTATSACSDLDPDGCDNCFTRITNTSVQSTCCSTNYCSTKCQQLALTTYHKPLCGQDFTWLQAPASSLTHNASPLRPLLMLRFLAAAVQAGPNAHPLDHPLSARLQPLANAGHVDVFTFTESVVTPLKILEQLGVDIFADHRFDMMVLQSIWARLANNKAGSKDVMRGIVDEITPHLPLFNHSCEPNVGWRRGDGSSTIWFLAKRDIAKGEELFSSYVDVEGMRVEERIEALWPWFEGDCMCEKCGRESART